METPIVGVGELSNRPTISAIPLSCDMCIAGIITDLRLLVVSKCDAATAYTCLGLYMECLQVAGLSARLAALTQEKARLESRNTVLEKVRGSSTSSTAGNAGNRGRL